MQTSIPGSLDAVGRRHWSERWPAILVLAMLPWLLYVWSVPDQFFFLDDRSLFWLRNPLVAEGDLKGAWQTWFGRHQGYTPLTNFTIWVDHALDFRAHPWLVRCHNLVWASLLVLGLRSFLACWLGRPLVAYVVAALFICHPLCAPLMLWPAMRRKLLFLVWSCWSLSWFIQAWSASGRRQAWGKTVVAVLASAMALGGNFHAVILAPIVVVLGLANWNVTKHRAVVITGIIGVGLLTLAFVVGEWIYMSAASVKPIRLGGGGVMGSVLADGPIFRDYLIRIVWPWHLTYYYAVRESGAMDVVNLVSWFVVVAIVTVSVRLHPQPRRALVLWVVALICLLPVMNLVNFPFAAADHYELPAVLPVLIILTEIILPRLRLLDLSLPGRLPWSWWVAGLSLAYLVPAAVMRISTFSDGFVATLWAMRIQPNTAIHRAYFVGTALGFPPPPNLRDRVGPAACAVFSYPDLFRVPSTLLVRVGFAAIDHLKEQGRLHEAEVLWTGLESHHSDPSLALCLRGVTAYINEDYARARDLLRPLLPLTPQEVDRLWDRCEHGARLPKITDGAFRDRANLMGLVSGYEQPDGETTLMIQQVMMTLAYAHAADDQYEEAAKVMVACLAINPRYYAAWTLLAECQALRGDTYSAGLATKRYVDLMEQIKSGLTCTEESQGFEEQFKRYRPRRFIPAATAATAREVEAANAASQSAVKE